jgi:hypothetical protein
MANENDSMKTNIADIFNADYVNRLKSFITTTSDNERMTTMTWTNFEINILFFPVAQG